MQGRTYTNHRWIIADVPRMYKQVLKELLLKRDLECVLFLRMLMETGICPGDLWLINGSNIKGREIIMKSTKYGQEYRDLQGRYPKMSKRTARIAEIVFKYGLHFEKPYSHYLLKIRKCCNEQRFSLHLMRHYYLYIRSVNAH